ncbi:MAG: beta-aspartyl-peptidase, partial [Chloroflexi bacterium]|nr:beta-aspartyl-peptidase [Chloroflexota bacterium]
MRLELATFEVRQVELSHKTGFASGLLTIGRGELAALVARDDAIAGVELELARPGESARIVHVLDAVEPLLKVRGSSCAFPGLLGPARTCGEGRTHRLKGLAVVVCGEFPEGTSGALGYREGFIDMSGPAAPYCTCSDTSNVVLLLQPATGITNEEWDRAIRLAGLSVASYLARTTVDHEPDAVEVFELGSVDSSLPRVVYVDQIQDQGLLVHTLVYGHHADNLLPTVLHPNEMLDGAVVSANYKGGQRVATCIHTMNPVVRALYRLHGREINFAGVVLSRGLHEDHQSL